MKFKVGDLVRFKCKKVQHETPHIKEEKEVYEIPDSYLDGGLKKVPQKLIIHGSTYIKKNVVGSIRYVDEKEELVMVTWKQLGGNNKNMCLPFDPKDIIKFDGKYPDFKPACGICALKGKPCKRHE